MLSNSAFNALLKTIEEPPPYVIFIFATTELQKVPATIKSRCQQFNFRLVAIDKVKECLAQAAAELNIQADDEALFWIARESTGSMRDAYTLFDQVVAFSDGHITYEKIRDKLGLVGIERLNSVFEACAQNQTETVINLLDEFLQGGISIEQLISNCADYLRSLLLIKSGIKKESLLGNSAERYSSLVLGAWNTVQVERALSIFLQLYRDIRYSLSPRYELELAFSRLCWIGEYVSNVEVKKAIDAAQNLLMQGAGAAGSTASQNKMMFAQPQQTSQVPVNTPPQAPPQSAPVMAAVQNQPSQPSGINVPNGLPRLSMLDNDAAFADEESDAPAEGDNSNPFHDGGFSSLPPEQTMDKADEQPKELDERLKIDVSTQSIQLDPSQVIKPEVIAAENGDFGYSLNPDDMDDGNWSNVDEPPPEPYYGEEEYYQEEVELSPMPPASQNQTQIKSQTVVTSSGPVTLEKLHDDVISSLSTKDSFAASTLEKTTNWHLNGLKIEAEVYSEYDYSLLQKKLPLINSELLEYTGTAFELHATLKEPQQSENSANQAEIPPQVRLLVDIFKGTLIGR
jgi:DNA polymerase-3 subunit gamma/tau